VTFHSILTLISDIEDITARHTEWVAYVCFIIDDNETDIVNVLIRKA